MKAMTISTFGPSNLFKMSEVPMPTLMNKENYVLIKVMATSMNPVDMKIRSGALKDIAPSDPIILHGDVAGKIVEVGPKVTRFKAGDEVYGCAGGLTGEGGALAEFMIADENLLALKPQSLSFLEAAALPLVGLTAWEALVDRAQVKKGQNVLVHAATGGVGHIGIQIARWLGAKVYATGSSADKLQIAIDLGAHEAINYRTQSVESYVNEHTAGKGFDVVFDTVGGENIDKSLQSAAVFGQVVSILSLSTHDLSFAHLKGLSLHVVFMLLPMLMKDQNRRLHQGNILEKIATIVDEGAIRPLLHSEVFTLETVAKAHETLESGRAVGKIVIKIAE